MLEVRDLTVEFSSRRGPKLRVIDRLSLDIAPGETVGLLGESGCGKTTLALTLIGLLPSTARVVSGSVRFCGIDVLLTPERGLEKFRGAKVSIIFQEPERALNPVMSVGDQVAEVLRAHTNWNRRRCRSKANSLLEQVQLPHARIYSAYPHQLSGGERQRVVIAQAVSCNPTFLIADEPTSALDNTTEAGIIAILKQMKDQLRVALLFITHNPLLLAGIADRVLVMFAGSVVEEGSAAQLLRQPHHPYTRRLLHCIPPLPSPPVLGKHNHGG